MRALCFMMLGAFVLSACADGAPQRMSRWDSYYARIDTPRAHVQVVPPEGTSLPMAELIAQYVVEYLQKENISAVVGDGAPSQGRHFVLTGYVEQNITDPRVRYRRILHWLLSDASGRLIATHAQGIEGTEQAWNFGDAQLLSAIGIGTAGPVSQMVLKETKSKAPIDPLRRGLLVENVTGLADEEAKSLTRAVAKALRTSDVLVTGDPRQASFRLAGHVEIMPGSDGFDDVRIVWRVQTMDRRELGNAVQENRVPSGAFSARFAKRWAAISQSVAAAAAVGVEHVFGTRAGPPPGATNYPGDEPPVVVLPGVPGRAMPPPR
ncbi:MAG: hypothetical protein JKY27_04000 [Magnetovibrio sp.]|nr:hypothetical protein [Magnetovibrio sp.]